MAVDTEAKRWSMLAFASGPASRVIVFNPDTSGLSSIEKITALQHYGGIPWQEEVAAPAAQRGGFVPPGAGIFPLRKRKEQVEAQIAETQAALEDVQSIIETPIDFAAIRDEVERAIAEELRRQAERDAARLAARLAELEALRRWLLKLLEDAAIILLSSA